MASPRLAPPTGRLLALHLLVAVVVAVRPKAASGGRWRAEVEPEVQPRRAKEKPEVEPEMQSRCSLCACARASSRAPTVSRRTAPARCARACGRPQCVTRSAGAAPPRRGRKQPADVRHGAAASVLLLRCCLTFGRLHATCSGGAPRRRPRREWRSAYLSAYEPCSPRYSTISDAKATRSDSASAAASADARVSPGREAAER